LLFKKGFVFLKHSTKHLGWWLTKIEKDAQWEEIFTILIFCSLVRRKRERVGGWAWLGTSGQKILDFRYSSRRPCLLISSGIQFTHDKKLNWMSKNWSKKIVCRVGKVSSNKKVVGEGGDILIFFFYKICAVNFGGIEKISVESKKCVLFLFVLLNHRDFTRHKVFHKKFQIFNATVQYYIFTIFSALFFVVSYNLTDFFFNSNLWSI